MKQTMKKLLTLVLVMQLVFVPVAPAAVYAEEAANSGQAATETNTDTTANTTASTVSPSPVPSTTEATPTVTDTPTPTPTLTEEEQERIDLLERRARSAAAKEEYLKTVEQGDASRKKSETSASVLGTEPVNNTGTVGKDSIIATGDANTNGQILNSANANGATSAGVSGNGPSATVKNTGNGSDSTNSGAILTNNSSTKLQDNNANLNNNLTAGATTGDNNNSKNTGGDSSITTGDANVTGTIINSVNTNVDGVLVAEFNVTDNHTGDLILDFGAGCVSGCGNGSINVANADNGSGSINNSAVYDNNDNATTQLNDAVIGNELVLNADSGNNTASKNTGGDSNITTGDANVAGNVLNFVNTNAAGNVIYSVVNIFGDLVGDIIMTEEAINNCCPGSNQTASNTGNGSGSSNTAMLDTNNSDTTTQTNDAVIDNNLSLNAQTGNNSTSGNTGGNSSIETGNVDVDANLLNIINTNLVGGNMWLVIVNEAGNWVGKLMGAPAGTNFAASEGTDYSIDENGYITASNNGNGSNSENNAEVQQNNTNTTTQQNNANLSNTLNLSANTGGNQASSNTGGDSNITTGDATIIANLVNFVNTNIVGDGKLVVSVVNVFGSWLGDFYTPGQEKKTETKVEEANKPGNNIGGTKDTNKAEVKETKTVKTETETETDNGTEEIDIESTTKFAYTGTTDSNIRGGAISEGTNQSKIAGVSTTNDGKNVLAKAFMGENVANDAIKINLAWLVLALPLAAIIFAGRKVIRRFTR